MLNGDFGRWRGLVERLGSSRKCDDVLSGCLALERFKRRQEDFSVPSVGAMDSLAAVT
jgi:hypothetical protein